MNADSKFAFKFKNFDADLKTALEEYDSKHKQTPEEIEAETKLLMTDWNAAHETGMKRYHAGVDAVFAAYLKNDTLDLLIRHFTKDLDAGGGDEYYLPISKRLVELQDGERLTSMWRSVIVTRQKVGKMDQAKDALNRLLDGLREIGDWERFERIVDESEALLSGRRTAKGGGKPRNDVLEWRDDDEVAGKTTKSKPKAKTGKSSKSRAEFSEDDFWNVIEQAKDESESPEERMFFIADSVSEKDSFAFCRIFGEKFAEAFTWDMWGVAYLIRGGCGDDSFEYFRAWLISEGKGTFERAVEDPQSLVDIAFDGIDPQAEELAAFAHMSKHPARPAGEKWDHKELQERFARAWAKFSRSK